jgi:serine protease Do
VNRLLAVPAVLLALTSPLAAQRGTGAGTGLRELSGALREVASLVLPSVVQIRVTSYRPEEEGGGLPATRRSSGSGVILSADGYLVTNAHVIAGGRQFVVVVPRPAAPGAPGRSAVPAVSLEVPARLVGRDRETDLAVLKVDLADLTPAVLGDSDSLAPGQVVLAFGSPLGLANSVTMGVVSAVGRQLRPEDPMVYIQTDTPINPGNSGGPLVDAAGRVVGVNTLILSQSGGSEGIGFAAPSNIVRRVYEHIRTHRRVRRGEIGVFAQSITPALAAGLKLARDWGVILGDVYPNSPAARAGLRPGDVILSVDGKPMENGRQFDVTLYRRNAGDQVALEVGRGLQRFTVRVPVVERQGDPARLSDMVSPERNLLPRLGVLGLDLTDELAQYLPGLREQRGVVVAGVADPGGGGGLEPGDVILEVGGAPVRTLLDLRAALDRLPTGSPAVLQVNRRGQLRFVTVTPE